ncbi:rod shape-determining protein MreC [Bacillota bacterium Meth-B3]
MAFGKKPKRPEPALRRGAQKKRGAWGRVMFAILVTLAIVALAFFLVVRDAERLSVVENAVGSVLSPIQNAVSSATRYVRGLIDGARSYAQMESDLAYERQKSALLELQLSKYEAYAIENGRLRDLLDVKERLDDMQPLFAGVIAKGPGTYMETFTINRGTNDGVAVGMPVATGAGLAGRVIEVGLNYAKVLSVIDPRSSIGAMVERTRDQGQIWGRTDASTDRAECHMYYVPSVNDIIPGDVVLTGGEGSLLPKGLVVGTVASVSRQSDLADRYIVVQPAVDFLHIEEVMVLRTTVERDDQPLQPLMTPTPQPTEAPTPTPRPEEVRQGEDEDQPSYWSYPTPRPPEGAQMTPAPSPTPAPQADLGDLSPEDRWAR